MTNFSINTYTFETYDFDIGEWVEWTDDETTSHGQIADRTKKAFTIDGTTVSGDSGEQVYKLNQFDRESREFSDDVIVRSRSRLSSSSGKPEPVDDDDPDSQEHSATLDGDEMSFAATAVPSPDTDSVGTGFNEFGVRVNKNEEGDVVSVDAIFEAMEPGPPERRNGVRITEEFLRNLANKDYSDQPPYLMDHEKDTLSQIGFVKRVWYSEAKDKLMLMSRAYNTGSPTHNEIISRLTFEPPTITDGSIGIGDSFETTMNDDGEVELVDARIREFSTTPFPGGYDNGGLRVE